jgi:hypothetical protein
MPDRESAKRPCPFCQKMINSDALRCIHCGAAGLPQAHSRKGPAARLSVPKSDPKFSGTEFALLPCEPAIIDDAPDGSGKGVWVLTGEDKQYCYYEYAGGIA